MLLDVDAGEAVGVGEAAGVAGVLVVDGDDSLEVPVVAAAGVAVEELPRESLR